MEAKESDGALAGVTSSEAVFEPTVIVTGVRVAANPASQRRVKVEAAKLRASLDDRLGRTTPQWVINLAQEQV